MRKFFALVAVLLILSCDKNVRECDDYTPFEETPGLRKYYTSSYSIMFFPDNKVKINTYFEGQDFAREGTYQYEIDRIECFCAGGEDVEGNCNYPTAKYFGSGTIYITSSNDSICPSEKLDLNFEITRMYSNIRITDNKCFALGYHDRN